MNSTTTHIDTTLTPDQLETDLRQLSLNIVREMYLASQKLLAYPASHPARKEVVNSAFFHLKNWLEFKFFYEIKTGGRVLRTEGIILEDNYFVKNFTSLLWKHHLKEVKFFDWITPEELSFFIDSLNSFGKDSLSRLFQHNITSIEVNPLIQRSFHFVTEQLGGKHTVENLAEEELKRSPSMIIKIALDRFDQGKVVTNFRERVLYSVAEKVFAELSPSLICQLIERELTTDGSSGLAEFMQLVNEHPQRELLLNDLDRIFRRAKLSTQDYVMYFETYCLYSPGKSNEYLLKDQTIIASEDDFLSFLSGLLKAGEYNKLRLILEGLVEQLTTKSVTARSKSLSLVKSTTSLLMADQTLVSYLNSSLIESWDEQKQTFEILDALCFLAESSLGHRHYLDFRLILDFLKRKTKEETSSYKQGVFRKALVRLTNTEVINRLIGDMNEFYNGERLFEIGECLKCINTKEVGEKLSRMTNHPHPARRMMSLEILTGMGDGGSDFVSQLLADKEITSKLEKEKSGPKNRVRILEVVEVLSRAGKREGIELLRKLCQSRDTEVRLKIASGLKNSYNPEALTLLRDLAVDPEPKVRLKALHSLKNKVSARDLEWLKAIYFEENKNLEELICVIGNLKVEDGDRFLFQALTQDKRLQNNPHCQIRILEVLSKRGRILSKEQIWRLRYEWERKSLFPFKKLVLRRRVNQLILQLDE